MLYVPLLFVFLAFVPVVGHAQDTGGLYKRFMGTGCTSPVQQNWDPSNYEGTIASWYSLLAEFNTRSYYPRGDHSETWSTTAAGAPWVRLSGWLYESTPGGTVFNGGGICLVETVPPSEPECEQGLSQFGGWQCGTWSPESGYNYSTADFGSKCLDGCEYIQEAAEDFTFQFLLDQRVWCRDEFVSTGLTCSPDAPLPAEVPGEAAEDENLLPPMEPYCDEGGGSTGSWFCDTRDPNHPEYDPNLPPVNEGDIYCDDQGGHDGLSWCNTWSPHHPEHPDYDGTGDGDGGTSGDGSYPGPGGGGTGGTGEGGEGDEPPQIGFCPPGTVQSERHFHGEDQTAVCVPEGDEFDESLDGLDLSGELPPGWLVMPTLPEPSAGTCSCPEDHVISVMGSSVPISYGPICGVAELLRPVFLLLVYLGLAFFLFRMVAGGNK